MYYRVTHKEGDDLACGYNCTSPGDVKDQLLDFLTPQIDDETHTDEVTGEEYNDLDNYKAASLEDILLMNDWQLDQQETPFPELEF